MKIRRTFKNGIIVGILLTLGNLLAAWLANGGPLQNNQPSLEKCPAVINDR